MGKNKSQDQAFASDVPSIEGRLDALEASNTAVRQALAEHQILASEQLDSSDNDPGDAGVVQQAFEILNGLLVRGSGAIAMIAEDNRDPASVIEELKTEVFAKAERITRAYISGGIVGLTDVLTDMTGVVGG